MVSCRMGDFNSNNLWTIRVSTRTSIVEVVPPSTTIASLHIIAAGLLGEGAKLRGWPQVVGSINYLDVPEVAGLAKSFSREVATAHGSGSVLTIWFRVHDLSSPLYHGGTVCKVGEEERRPVT